MMSAGVLGASLAIVILRRPPFLVDESADMRGHAFLTSSAETEAAQESDRIQASYFTHFLVSGFRGAADQPGSR